MSIKVMSWVFENGPADPSERLVLLALADYASDNGEWSPSMIGIAEKSGMTERGARGVIRRLEANGWIAVKVGGGRGGRSHYRVIMGDRKGEHQTRNDKPGMINPEPKRHKPGTKQPETRNHGSAEPSEPSEPSLYIGKSAKHPAEIILDEVGLIDPEFEAAVHSFVEYRRKSKKGGPLTATAAKRVAHRLKDIMNDGHDPVDALGTAEECGWTTVYPPKGNASGKSSQQDTMLRASENAARAFASGLFGGR